MAADRSAVEHRAQDAEFIATCQWSTWRVRLPLHWPTPRDMPPSPKHTYRSQYVYLGCADLDDPAVWEHLTEFDLLLRFIDWDGLRPVLAALLGWTSACGYTPFDPVSIFLLLGWQLTNRWTRAQTLRNLADARYADYAQRFGFQNSRFPTEGGLRHYLTAPGVTNVPVCQETSGTVVDGMWRSEVSKNDERYLLYLPPCYEYDLRRRYPTIYLIHGINSDDTFWESLGVFEKMDEGLRAGKYPPALIVSVDGSYDLFINTSGGPGSYEAQIVEELVPIIDRLYRTGTNNSMRAIGGISRGGVWSLEIGFRNPDLFGIVAGHSPCLHYNESPVLLDPLRMTIYLTLKRQRIWLDAGDEDGCLPDTEDMHAGLDSVGASHEYHIWPGQHAPEYWSAHVSYYLEFYTREW